MTEVFIKLLRKWRDKMIAKVSITDLVKAIRMASEDGVKTVEVDMDDLLIMCEHLDDIQADSDYFENEVLILQNKLRLANISLAKAELKAIEKPIKLDAYA
jgi:hypothetical protein